MCFAKGACGDVIAERFVPALLLCGLVPCGVPVGVLHLCPAGGGVVAGGGGGGANPRSGRGHKTVYPPPFVIRAPARSAAGRRAPGRARSPARTGRGGGGGARCRGPRARRPPGGRPGVPGAGHGGRRGRGPHPLCNAPPPPPLPSGRLSL